jgi:hypothetical protein
LEKSRPALRMCFASAWATVTSIMSPVREASSWISMWSAPSGKGAPVKIRIASPCPTGWRGSVPAGISPVTFSRLPALRTSERWTAYPSIAETSAGGVVVLARTSRANTRPSASPTGIASSPASRTCGASARNASSTLIRLLTMFPCESRRISRRSCSPVRSPRSPSPYRQTFSMS